jgi:hypothetical protein
MKDIGEISSEKRCTREFFPKFIGEYAAVPIHYAPVDNGRFQREEIPRQLYSEFLKGS